MLDGLFLPDLCLLKAKLFLPVPSMICSNMTSSAHKVCGNIGYRGVLGSFGSSLAHCFSLTPLREAGQDLHWYLRYYSSLKSCQDTYLLSYTSLKPLSVLRNGVLTASTEYLSPEEELG